ncbi:MAG: UDP-N-acetylmuramoyl-L-alanine--D-glutamate ligase [Fusobacteriota bacterium]
MRYLIYGNGKSGQGACNLLKKDGQKFDIIDDNIAYDQNQVINELPKYDYMIKSPGIPNDKKIIKKAIEANVEIIDEIELAYRYCESKIIAITGANGKTTVTTKLTELLKFSGYDVISAGNIGRSFAKVVATGKKYDFIVLEVSSFQLEHIKKFRPNISILTNLTPDHLNRYKNKEEYYGTKFKIFKNQTKNNIAILNADNKATMDLLKKININARKIFISQTGKGDLPVKSDAKRAKIILDKDKKISIKDIKLKGKHNIENILFIIAVAREIGISNEKIQNFIINTSPLEHRMENFLKIKNTIFINDSKATNIDSAKKAIESFDDIILITGGKDKDLDLDNLIELMGKKAKKIFLIGETAKKIENKLMELNYSKKNIFNIIKLENLEKSLLENIDFNNKNVVLFSPAASSYDQFKNYEERGRQFKDIIKNIGVENV